MDSSSDLNKDFHPSIDKTTVVRTVIWNPEIPNRHEGRENCPAAFLFHRFEQPAIETSPRDHFL